MAGLLIGGIFTGASLAGSTTAALTAQSAHSVVCTVEVHNYTQWPLVAPIAYTRRGYLQSSPGDVMPGKREAIVSHKNDWTASGIFATLSWLVNGKERVFAMWCSPFNFNHWSNEFGVGVIGPYDHDKAQEITEDLYDIPIDKWDTWRANSVGVRKIDRRAYYNETREVTANGDLIYVTGNMGSSHKTEALISVFPKKYEHLASAIKYSVSEKDYMTIVKK